MRPVLLLLLLLLLGPALPPLLLPLRLPVSEALLLAETCLVLRDASTA